MKKMEIEYQVSRALQLKAADQLFYAVLLKKKWIGILGFWIVSFASVLLVPELGWAPTGILFGISFILAVSWFKTHQTVRKQALETLDLSDDPKTKIKIEEGNLVIDSNTGNRSFKWNKISCINKTKDFLIPMSKSIPLICIPLSELTPEMEKTIFEKVRSNQAR